MLTYAVQKFDSHSQDHDGNNMTCANNCRGVNPNAVIVGGVGVLAAAVASQQVLLQAAGLGAIGLGAIGVGGASALMNINRCPNTRPCRVSHLVFALP